MDFRSNFLYCSFCFIFIFVTLSTGTIDFATLSYTASNAIAQQELNPMTVNKVPTSVTVVSSSNKRQAPTDLYRFVYPQLYQNGTIPVAFGYLATIINSDTLEVVYMDDLQDVPAGVNLSPVYTAEQAINAAISAWCPALNCGYANASAILYVFPNPAVISYNVSFFPIVKNFHHSIYTIFINGNTLGVLYTIDGRHSFSATNGTSLYSGTVSFSTNFVSSSNRYYLEDTVRQYGVYSCNSGNCSVQTGFSSSSNTWTTTSVQGAVQVAWAVSKVLDYFSNTFGRNGIDDAGGPQITTSSDSSATPLFAHLVNYGVGFNDALYTPTGIVYGSGDGVNFTQLVSLDFVGHEIMHGIISYVVPPSGFMYTGESGAIEEAYCDVFGAMAERYVLGENYKTWQIGEDFYTPNIAGDALRYLDYPHNATNQGYTSDDNPDYMTQLYTGLLDNGGVHENCGIPSKAFYLLAHGGQHELGGPILTGIGADAAALIWWNALITYMNPSSTFSDAATAHGYAARDAYGINSMQYTDVASAWAVCGVGSLPNPLTYQMVINGSFEQTSLPWVLINASAVLYVKSGANFHTGRGYMSLGLTNLVSGSLFQTYINVSANAVSASLSLWLKVVTTEPVNGPPNDIITLVIKTTAGITLNSALDQFSNTGSSAYTLHGPYNLLPYKGQSLIIQADVSNSNANPTSFYVDDVGLLMQTY